MMIYLMDGASRLLSVITSRQKEQDQGSTDETACRSSLLLSVIAPEDNEQERRSTEQTGEAVCNSLSSLLKTKSEIDDIPKGWGSSLILSVITSENKEREQRYTQRTAEAV
jgi:hypothetical protein